MKYTREDVIVTREQAEKAGLKIGSICYFNDRISDCIECANNNGYKREIDSIDWDSLAPFRDKDHGFGWECVIIKKGPGKKIVPFDFTLKEDKQILRGKTVEYHCLHGSGLDKENPVYDIEECNIVGFHKHSGHDYWQAILCYCNSDYTISVTAEELLDNYVFADTGLPAGKEVEE